MRGFSFAPGDYLRSPTKLLCVEQIDERRAVLEDCRTGELISVPLSVLFALSPVRAAPDTTG
jgi:hypothetical protein